jgi:hypothetical protein
VTKRSIARVVSFDHESLALVLMIAALGTGSASAGDDGAGGRDTSRAGAGSASAGEAKASEATAGEKGSTGNGSTEEGAAEGPASQDEVSGPGTGPERLLSSLFGAGLLRDITAAARQDLHERVAALLDVELGRFTEVIDAAGVPDETVAAQLIEAGDALEAVR